jgi:hypothetical protein
MNRFSRAIPPFTVGTRSTTNGAEEEATAYVVFLCTELNDFTIDRFSNLA